MAWTLRLFALLFFVFGPLLHRAIAPFPGECFASTRKFWAPIKAGLSRVICITIINLCPPEVRSDMSKRATTAFSWLLPGGLRRATSKTNLCARVTSCAPCLVTRYQDRATGACLGPSEVHSSFALEPSKLMLRASHSRISTFQSIGNSSDKRATPAAQSGVGFLNPLSRVAIAKPLQQARAQPRHSRRRHAPLQPSAAARRAKCDQHWPKKRTL